MASFNKNLKLYCSYEKKTLNFILAGIIIIGIAALVFIHFTNNHMECNTVTKISVGLNGEKVVVDRHICKERYKW